MDALLNDAVWTTKEVLYAIGSVIGVLITTFLTIYRLLYTHLRDQLATSQSECNQLREQVKQLESRAESNADEELEARLGEVSMQKAELEIRLTQLTNELSMTAAQFASERAQLLEKAEMERRKINKALQCKTFSWDERVAANKVEFRSLEERQTPIISVLNLKGGVGKTTISANLGGALMRRGWRVLFIDLDLQGSLTSMFLPEQRQVELSQEKRFIGDFLAQSFDAEFPKLTEFAEPVAGFEESAIVGTVDTLAYAETALTVRWLLREANRDVRFLLRKELHLKRISDRYDIVLLDCPPLINISCVNALVASDYVLIPVMPSKQVTDRVPTLIKRLLQFRSTVNEQIKILGLVANRTRSAKLTSDEQNRMSELSEKGKNAFGEAVYIMSSAIPTSIDIRTAEDEHRPLSNAQALASDFARLAAEIETRLPTFCRGRGKLAPNHAKVTV